MIELGNAFLVLIENSSIKDLTEIFDFDDGFEIIDAINQYAFTEHYNACAALDFILSKNILEFVNHC
jgi:hypothetical protein